MVLVVVVVNVEIVVLFVVEDMVMFCDFVCGVLCFWWCERDYFFVEGLKCARARDACAAACRLLSEWVM